MGRAVGHRIPGTQTSDLLRGTGPAVLGVEEFVSSYSALMQWKGQRVKLSLLPKSGSKPAPSPNCSHNQNTCQSITSLPVNFIPMASPARGSKDTA